MKTSGYNIMRDDSALLEEHGNAPPSFSVHLYPDHWTLNNGPKFSYTNPVSSILDDIRAFRIPTDFIPIFDDVGVPYYSGCLIVEILDFRPARAKEPILERPDKQRVVLRPNGETLWADLCIMNGKAGSKWSDMDTLQIESKLLLSTSTPLCLDPDPSLARFVNSILRVSTPNIPNSLKRKAVAMTDFEEDETEKAKRAKIMQFMNPQFSPSRKPFLPNYKILSVLEQQRTTPSQRNPQPAPRTSAPVAAPLGTMAPSSIYVQPIPDNTSSTTAPQLTTAYSQASTVPQPAPVAAPQAPVPPQLQHATDPSQRASPAKQQQGVNGAVTQRPPSQAVAAPQSNAANQQAQGQQSTPPVQFNPPLPPSDFLNPTAPVNRRRPSLAVKPSTPATANASLPAQQPANSQMQPQLQPQALTQAQVQTQTLPQHPTVPQAAGQPQTQRVPPQAPQHVQQQARAAQLRNMVQFYQNSNVPAQQQAVAIAAAQRQNMNGRNTPVSRANSSASPIPSSSVMAHGSPMLPASAAAVMSRQNTPVATNTQVARGSPLAGNHPIAARVIAAQNVPQQQQQQPMPGVPPVMMPNGAAVNPALYQHYQRLAFMQARAAQQAQMQPQGHMTPASQQQQQNQQPGTTQTGQDQTTSAQQQFSGVQIPPQAFNYMQMNMNAAQQQYLWQQRAMGRGIAQAPPNGQQQIPVMPPGMTMQQMQGLGRGGNLPNR